MLSSRITLSLAAVGFSCLATLAWTSVEGPAQISIAAAQPSMKSYLLLVLGFASVVFWMMTYFRSLDASYLISSRVLLSVFAAAFGVMTTLYLLHFGTLQAISFATMSGWLLGAYAGGTLGCAWLWLATYFKTCGLVGGGRTAPTCKTRV